ncbi:MAG TPA: hypothetical protein VKQ70_00515 [Caulobacteraceae bacterium]|jgi:hypothetical protein|nr:hypothetical protein [Caulobacteraceae bacterium]
MEQRTRGARTSKYNAPPQGFTQLELFEYAESKASARAKQLARAEASAARRRSNCHLDEALGLKGSLRFQNEALANHHRRRAHELSIRACGGIG